MNYNYDPVVKIDPADLLDSTDVAQALRLSSVTAVATYRARYADFPEPLIVKGSGKCVLWLRKDIDVWVRNHPRRSPESTNP